MKYGDVSYGFEVFIGDEYFSSGTASSLDECIREANHYAFMASESGPVTVNYYQRMELLEVGAS